MIQLQPPFRLATPDDAPTLAELVNIAGDGLPLHVWRRLAEDSADPWELGRQRQAAKAAEGQIVVADHGEGAVAGLTGYAIGVSPDSVGEDVPPLFRPLMELENAALSSWYVNVLACFPAQRGKGLGSGLLRIAEEIARDAGVARMSVIVADTNAGARRLYAREGYAETDTRPCVKNGWIGDVDNWILMIKPLAA